MSVHLGLVEEDGVDPSQVLRHAREAARRYEVEVTTVQTVECDAGDRAP